MVGTNYIYTVLIMLLVVVFPSLPFLITICSAPSLLLLLLLLLSTPSEESRLVLPSPAPTSSSGQLPSAVEPVLPRGEGARRCC